MITMETINGVLFAPVFFFVAIFLFLLTGFSLLLALHSDSAFMVIGCIAFVFGYNAWMFGLKLRKS